MLQFYFLSILLNTVTGVALLYVDADNPDLDTHTVLPPVVKDETFRLVLGILTAVTGFFKILSAVRGDIPVLGDLLPALAGLAGGFALIYEFYKGRSSVDDETLPAVILKLAASKRYIGVVCLLAAALHFLFPAVLFL